jgi:activator of HSP90 ATPase
MSRVIRQSVQLAASSDDLFDAYLDRRGHAAVTGGKVTISARPGSRFSAFDGMITGRTLEVLPKRLIVQSWRSGGWQDDDPDSILLLAFSAGRHPGTGRIDLIHIGVPDHDHDGVVNGWKFYYWRPWRAYLKRRSSHNTLR